MKDKYITRNGVTIPSYAYPLLKDYVSQYEKAGGKNFTVKFKDKTIVETLKLLRKEKNNLNHMDIFWDEYDDWDWFDRFFCYDGYLPHPDTYNVAQDYEVQTVIKYIWNHVKKGFQIIEKPSATNPKLNGVQKYALVVLWFVVLSPTMQMLFFGGISEDILTKVITFVAGVIGVVFLIWFSLVATGNSLKNFSQVLWYSLWRLNRTPLKTKVKHPEILAYLLQENPIQEQKLDR